MGTIDYVAECGSRNPGDTCAATACAVDANFIRGVVNYLAFNSLNQTLNGFLGFDGEVCGVRQHTGTTANPEMFTTDASTTEAPNAQTTITTLTAPIPSHDCCGQYPQRFPFQTQNGGRACCESVNGNGVTYSTSFLECCAD